MDLTSDILSEHLRDGYDTAGIQKVKYNHCDGICFLTLALETRRYGCILYMVHIETVVEARLKHWRSLPSNALAPKHLTA